MSIYEVESSAFATFICPQNIYLLNNYQFWEVWIQIATNGIVVQIFTTFIYLTIISSEKFGYFNLVVVPTYNNRIQILQLFNLLKGLYLFGEY